VDEHPRDHPFVDSDEEVDEPAAAPKRRRWPIVLVSVFIVIVALGVALYVAASHYQPLSQSLDGGYGSEVLSSNGVLAANRVTGAGANTVVVWTEPTGSFRVEVVFTITNVERFPVTIDAASAPPNPSGTSNVHVYVDSKPKAEGAYGLKGGPTFTPVTLASGGQLELAIHWDQQCVPTSAASGATKYTSLPVSYTFLGFHHTVDVPIQTLTITPRATC
jgi:hypothetical protein